MLILIPFFHRFPGSLPYVILDILEKVYLAGFGLLQLFILLFPIFTAKVNSGGDDNASGLEFLPLMLTSTYCAIGLVWAFVRLSVLYLKQQHVKPTQ